MGEVWFTPDDLSLPMPWKGIVDGNTQCLYYWNPETNITQYEKPVFGVSSPALSPSCSPSPFSPPHPTTSDYNLHSQYPNLYPHYQAPAETVINGYTFPTQFPFPNHTHTPTNQPINPQSQSSEYHYHSLPRPPIAHPSYHLSPFATSVYASESGYGYLSSLSYPSDQPFSCDPYSICPHNSSYSPITYPHTEPKESIVSQYQLPYATDLIPPSSLAYTTSCTSCTKKDDVPLPKMKKSLCHNLKMRSHVMMKRKPRSQFPRRRRIQNNGGSKGNLCKAPLLVAVEWDSIVLSHKSLDSVSELTILDFEVKYSSISTSSKDAPMFFLGDKKKLFLSADVVYGQLLGSDELYQSERAKDIVLLEGFQHILDKKGSPLVDRELSLIDMEFARSYLNLHLEMPLMDSGNMPESNVQGAILNHFDQVTNLISGLKPNLLSMSFVESPVILEVLIHESSELGSKHEVIEFDKLMGRSVTAIKLIKPLGIAHLAHLQATLPNWQVIVKNVLSSNKGGFEYDMNLGTLIGRSNSQKLFVSKHGKRIESKCAVLYHWLPSSLNWNQKYISDAFLSLKLFVSFVTSKSLLSESCSGGGMSMEKAMEETLLENIALQIVIATNCADLQQLSYPMHLVKELTTKTVQCISLMQLWHMGISYIIDTTRKRLENSSFGEQLKKHYGVFCFVILVEGYLMTILLYFDDHIFHIWSHMWSKIGACTIIELPRCMNKMWIFSLDSTSWKLVLKHVKTVIQVNIFYYYVQWVVTLDIIQFGCGFFSFLYEFVDWSSTTVKNSTVIIRGAKDGNLLHWKMAIGTLGHLKLYGPLEFDVEVCLVFCIYVSTSILDADLENIRKTFVSANSTTTLRRTTWEVMLILHGLCCKVSLLFLFEIAPQQFSVATLATKVILDQTTLLNVESAFVFLTEMEFWRIRWFVGDVGTDKDNRTHMGNWFIDKVGITIILDMALVECIVRATTIKTLFHKLANFAHSPTLELRLHGCIDIFVGLHVDNNLAMLLECLTFYVGVFCFNTAVLMWVGHLTLKSATQILYYLALLIGEGLEQYHVRSLGLDIIAQMLLVVNINDVVVKKGMLTLSSHKLLICVLVMKENIVAAAAEYKTVRGKEPALKPMDSSSLDTDVDLLIFLHVSLNLFVYMANVNLGLDIVMPALSCLHKCKKIGSSCFNSNEDKGIMLFDEDGPMPNTHTVHEGDCQLQDGNSHLALLRQNLYKAQERIKLFHDKRHTERTFEVGDSVYMKLQSYKQQSVEKRTVHKLLAKYYGPSEEIERIGTVAYKLKLPASARTHTAKVINTMLLKRKDQALAKWLIKWIGLLLKMLTGSLLKKSWQGTWILTLEEEVLQLKLEDKLFFQGGKSC